MATDSQLFPPSKGGNSNKPTKLNGKDLIGLTPKGRLWVAQYETMKMLSLLMQAVGESKKAAKK